MRKLYDLTLEVHGGWRRSGDHDEKLEAVMIKAAEAAIRTLPFDLGGNTLTVERFVEKTETPILQATPEAPKLEVVLDGLEKVITQP